jgi:hypothetical protein
VPRHSRLLTVAAGLLTPLLFLALLALLQSASLGHSDPPPGRIVLLASAFLFATGFAIAPPIHPLLYGALLVPGFAVCFALFPGSGGNLMGLVATILLFAGLIVGAAAGLCGWFAQRRRLPDWAPAAPVIAGCLLLIGGQIHGSLQADNETSAIVGVLKHIGQAEQAYAGTRPNHDYTCNGPDLPNVTGIEWRTDFNFGGPDRNQGKFGDYWIVLRCQHWAHSPTMSVDAFASWPGGPRFTLDPRTGIVAPPGPLR